MSTSASASSSASIELMKTKYAQIQTTSSHGGGQFFTIDDVDDDDEDLDEIEVNFTASSSSSSSSGPQGINHDQESRLRRDILEDLEKSRQKRKEVLPKWQFRNFWTILTFGWMEDLLKLGHRKALELDDLYTLPSTDSAEMVFKRFQKAWQAQMKSFYLHHHTMTESDKPSLIYSLLDAYGKPFYLAAGLKLVHDTLLFMGPMILNVLIKFLNNSTDSLYLGLFYVLCLFVINLLMSLCLRQYFW